MIAYDDLSNYKCRVFPNLIGSLGLILEKLRPCLNIVIFIPLLSQMTDREKER